MKLLIAAALLVAMMATGWYIYTKILESKRRHRFARKRARDAIAWQKILDQNAADRANSANKLGQA